MHILESPRFLDLGGREYMRVFSGEEGMWGGGTKGESKEWSGCKGMIEEQSFKKLCKTRTSNSLSKIILQQS